MLGDLSKICVWPVIDQAPQMVQKFENNVLYFALLDCRITVCTFMFHLCFTYASFMLHLLNQIKASAIKFFFRARLSWGKS